MAGVAAPVVGVAAPVAGTAAGPRQNLPRRLAPADARGMRVPPVAHPVALASALAVVALAPAGPAAARPHLAGPSAPTPRAAGAADAARAAPAGDCHQALRDAGATFTRTRRAGITQAVSIDGALGGVTYQLAGRAPMVIDCSLALSLALAGRYLVALGIDHATVSSAHSKRNVRGSNRPSKHSFGLAVDIPALRGPRLGALSVAGDFEQGLGDGMDCIGQPLTPAGGALKVAQCQLVHSGLFHLVLSPDYDDAHHDHFHLEAKPWPERPSVWATSPAIH